MRKESVPIKCDGLLCPAKNTVVYPEIVGNGSIKVGILGEAPYKEEVAYGEPFIGESGQLLRQYFDLDECTYFIFNTVNCMTIRNSVVIKPSEMGYDEFKGRFAMCRPFREQIMDLLDNGSVIMAFGRFAQQALFADKMDPSDVPIFYDYKKKMLLAYSNYHPAYVLYRPSYKVQFEDILTASGVFAPI